MHKKDLIKMNSKFKYKDPNLIYNNTFFLMFRLIRIWSFHRILPWYNVTKMHPRSYRVTLGMQVSYNPIMFIILYSQTIMLLVNYYLFCISFQIEYGAVVYFDEFRIQSVAGEVFSRESFPVAPEA